MVDMFAIRQSEAMSLENGHWLTMIVLWKVVHTRAIQLIYVGLVLPLRALALTCDSIQRSLLCVQFHTLEHYDSVLSDNGNLQFIMWRVKWWWWWWWWYWGQRSMILWKDNIVLRSWKGLDKHQNSDRDNNFAMISVEFATFSQINCSNWVLCEAKDPCPRIG